MQQQLPNYQDLISVSNDAKNKFVSLFQQNEVKKIMLHLIAEMRHLSWWNLPILYGQNRWLLIISFTVFFGNVMVKYVFNCNK